MAGSTRVALEAKNSTSKQLDEDRSSGVEVRVEWRMFFHNECRGLRIQQRWLDVLTILGGT
jgi:hypothetical protein